MNLMSYSISACRNQVTPNQISKVLQVLRENNKRKNLITSGAHYVDPLASKLIITCTYDEPCRTLAESVQVSRNEDFIFLRPGVHHASSLGGKQVTLNRWGTEGVVNLMP